MSAPAFTLDGTSYSLIDLPTIAKIVEYADAFKIVQIIGCERDKRVCIIGADCECCIARAESGTYPDDGRGHLRLCSVAEFRARANRFGARRAA